MIFDTGYLVIAGVFIVGIILSVRGMFKYMHKNWLISFMWFSALMFFAINLYGISLYTTQDNVLLARVEEEIWLLLNGVFDQITGVQ